MVVSDIPFQDPSSVEVYLNTWKNKQLLCHRVYTLPSQICDTIILIQSNWFIIIIINISLGLYFLVVY